MSEKPVVERILKYLENRLDVNGKSGSWLTSPEAHLLLDGIREMQEEIRKRGGETRRLRVRLLKGRAVMEVAIMAIKNSSPVAALRVLERYLAKDQPKDNGAGGEE